MEWVAVLCLLSGERCPEVVCVRLDGQVMSGSTSISSSAFSTSTSVFVEGQGDFRQPPSDNYNLPLDLY